MVHGVQYHQTVMVPRESILKTEAEWLNSIKALLHGWSVALRAEEREGLEGGRALTLSGGSDGEGGT